MWRVFRVQDEKLIRIACKKDRTTAELDLEEWNSLLAEALRRKGYAKQTEALEIEQVIL